MKSLLSYIKEELNQYKYTIPELKVTWSAPDKVYVQVPSNMDDDAITQYMNDVLIEQTPVGTQYAKKLFDKQADNINDATWQFDKCEDAQSSDVIYVAYNGDNKSNNDLTIKEIDGLKLTATFVDFVVANVKDIDSIDNALWTIFKNTQSSYTNKWIVELTLDKDDITYDKNTINQR